jgi:hypothetical protein
VMVPNATCPEREARLKQYRDSVQAYAKAVLCLDGDLTPKEFEVAHKSAEKARAEFDRTRKELKEHVTSHGCQPQSMLPGGKASA